MKLLAFLFLLASIISTPGSAQGLFKQGYVVLNSGDTVRGFVEDLEWNLSPNEINFKTAEGAAPRKYTTDEITAFYTSRPVRYETLKVRFDGDYLKGTKFAEAREPLTWVEETLFLEVLVRSAGMSLYLLAKNDNAHFIIRNGSNPPEELLSRLYYTDDGTKKVVVTSQQWKQQLSNASGCPDMQSQIVNSNFTASRLTSLVESINLCNNEKNIMIQTTSVRRKPTFGLVGQFFVSEIAAAANIGSYMSSLNVGGGVFIEFFSRKKPNRTSFYNEIKFKTYSQEGTTNNTPSTFTMSSVKMVNALRFSSSRSLLFINPGFINGYRMNTEIKYKDTGVPVGGPSKSGFETGLLVGAGKRFIMGNVGLVLELRYEREIQLAEGFQGTESLSFMVQVGFN